MIHLQMAFLVNSDSCDPVDYARYLSESLEVAFDEMRSNRREELCKRRRYQGTKKRSRAVGSVIDDLVESGGLDMIYPNEGV